MKKVIILLFCIICFTAIHAQKIYSTKSGNISFFSSTPLEDIEAKSSEVESKFASGGQLVFTLLMKGFEFENQEMQDHFNDEYLESTKYPKAGFKGNIINMTEVNLTKNGVYPAKVKGGLIIHGVTKDVTADGTIEVRGAKVIVRSKFNIALKDFNIGGALIGKKIAPAITINVNCEYE